jgi:hypothetical protein
VAQISPPTWGRRQSRFHNERNFISTDTNLIDQCARPKRNARTSGGRPLRGGGVNPIPRRGDSFTPADGAPAGSGEPGSIAKHEPAVRTGRRFENEAAGTIPCEGLDHMR